MSKYIPSKLKKKGVTTVPVELLKSITDATLKYKSGVGIIATFPDKSEERCCNFRSDGTNSTAEINQYWCCLLPHHEGDHAAYTMGKVGTKKPIKTWQGALQLKADGPKCILCGVLFCDICGMCENDECAVRGKSARTKDDLIKLRHMLAKTQKIRGYVTLASSNLPVPQPYKVVSEPDEVQILVPELIKGVAGGKLFVRPCPIRPRHGFVDSRVVSTEHTDAVLKIFAEAKAADPEAELLICPAIDATHNLIITPTRMAIGPGNDGATAGKGSVVVPLAGVRFAEITDDILKRSNVDIVNEDPYIEVVTINGAVGAFSGAGYKQTQFTQLRAGVKIPASVGADYVPRDMVVGRVIEASGDLLEWERQAALLQPNDVVYHAGGTLISHYGVHCMFHKIAVITSHKPEIGEVLQKIDNAPKPDPAAISEGLAVGTRFEIHQGLGTFVPGQTSCNQAALIVLYALHNAAAMGGRDAFWVGVGVSFMMRLGMAASHGEARHSNAQRRGISREQIYKLALNDFFVARTTLGIAQERFKHYSWSSGYGGSKWASCTDSVFRMDNAVRAFLKAPTEDAITELIASLNNAVNQAHNGGWWLNKFITVDAFDKAAKQSLYSLAGAGPSLHNVLTADRSGVAEIISKWRDEPDIVIPSGPSIYKDGTLLPVDPVEKKAEVVPTEAVGPKVVGIPSISPPDGSIPAHTTSPAPKSTELPMVGPEVVKPAKKLKVSHGNPAESVGVHSNMNGVVPLPSGAQITAAHGRMAGTDMHVQVRVTGLQGYYSFGVTLPKYVGKVVHTDPSYSGADTKYVPLNWVHGLGDSSLTLLHTLFGEVKLPSLASVIGKHNEPTAQ